MEKNRVPNPALKVIFDQILVPELGSFCWFSFLVYTFVHLWSLADYYNVIKKVIVYVEAQH